MKPLLGVGGLLLVPLLSASLLAQVGTGFLISDGNTFFRQGDSPTSGTTSSVPAANFSTTGFAGTDHLVESWWWYRVTGVNPREIAFNNAIGTVVMGDQATTTWTFPEGFTAVLNYNVNSLGSPTTGELIERLVLTNTTSATITVDFFKYVDYDANGSPGNDNASGGVPLMTISDGPATLQFQGPSALDYQVTSFSTLRGLLTDAAVNNLDNTGLPVVAGDFTGALQWSVQLQPALPITLRSGGAGTVRLAGIPEPTTLLWVAIATLGLVRSRPRH